MDENTENQNEGDPQEDAAAQENVADQTIKEDWSTDAPVTQEFYETEVKDVSDYDIFNLAKKILAVCAVIFILLAMYRMSPSAALNEDGVKDVWDFSKVALNSIVSLVLGLYFGKKSK